MTKGNQIDLTQRRAEKLRLIEEVRNNFRSHFETHPETYDANDVEKVFTNDFYIDRFLRWCRHDPKKTLNMVIKCFQWRKSSQLIYRKPDDFPMEFYASGALFRYQSDREGYPTLYMRVKFIRKVIELDEPLKDFICYKINEIDQHCGKSMSWTIVFDCNDIGFANVHFEMLRFLVSTMINYFPFGVRRIIILDVPWILDKVQKMVLAMLPEEAKKIAIFTSKKEITKYIAPENLPDYLGGTCSLPYCEVPAKVKPFQELANYYNLTQKQLDKLRDLYKSSINFPAAS